MRGGTVATLVAPALIVVGAAVIAPTLWMLYQSILYQGEFSLHHYQRLFTSRLHQIVIRQTFELALTVTVICVAIGTPFAWFASRMASRARNALIGIVVVTFFASLLVRTYAWLVLLQGSGLVNDGMIALGLVSEPLQLVHNRTGTVIGMVHIMLPFFILPAYSAFLKVPNEIVQAARSLGATAARAFLSNVLPLAASGIATGTTFVFVLSLGFYVTPALLGGGRVMTAPMLLARDLSRFSEWGTASALGAVLLAATVGLAAVAYWLIGRRTDADRAN
ncbi:ABC transporter permease [Boseongicola sp. H5]|uniref:ABC transporter permease n=1 Tax=Boseongicola sp. H5 TaxID=2763261 RepID=UPI001D0AEC36|nr:ABC transporter permease [Boseongicola sp. H5]